MSLEKIRYELHVETDLHIGSGVGLPGVVDEHVVRDQEELAFAPFSGIKGMARDSCAQLMKHLGCLNDARYACDSQRRMLAVRRIGAASPKGFCSLQNAAGLCALCAIFGSPMSEARWWFSPATYAESYRQAVEFGASLAIAGETDKTKSFFARRDAAFSAHAAIDPRTKRAAEQQLFNLEVIRQPEGALWEGVIISRPPITGKAPVCDEKELFGWLLAALLFTRRLGGRRRRGWGRCRFRAIEPDAQKAQGALDVWLDILQQSGKIKNSEPIAGGDA